METVRTNNRSAGFTLIELMIVMLVAAILTAVAVPTYQSQVRHSRRTDAKTAVLDLAAREEKYFSLNNTYTASPANLGYAATGSATAFPVAVGSNYYNIYACPAAATGTTSTTSYCTAGAVITATGNTYVVAAIALAGTSQANDSSCQYFAVDNTGTQYASGSASGGGTATTSTCWQ